MVKRGQGFVLILIFSFFASLGLVSANFVCGTVVNADNSSTVSPSWINVKLSYNEKPSVITTCQVSPDDNKYCCNPRDISNVTWAVGKTVSAYINDLGYYASNVSNVISGAGYDIFPDLKLEKSLDLIEPNASFYLNITSLKVTAKIASKYSSLSYSLQKNGTTVDQNVVCTSCNNASFLLSNLSSGQYTLFAKAYNPNEEYIQNFTFSVLKYINFKRSLECVGCKNLKVPSDAQSVSVTISVNASDPIKGNLQDVFPSDWVYEGSESMYEYSDSHNVINWNVEGQNIVKTYSLIPPKNIFNSKYVFQSNVDAFYSPESIVSLSKFAILDFLGLKKVILKSITPTNLIKNVKVTSENPVVIYPTELEVTQVAIFPKTTAYNVLSFVKKTKNMNLNNSKSNFMIGTSLNQTNVDRVFIDFSINKKSIKKNQNVSLYYYNVLDANWMNIPISVLSENKTQVNYQTMSNRTGGYSIVIS